MAANSSNTRRRRGKKESGNSASSSASSSNKKDGAAKLEEQLNNAQESIERSQRAVAILHEQWKGYLLRLSFVLILISLQQAYGPATSCWDDVQAVNANAAATTTNEQTGETVPTLSTAQSILLVTADSFLYVVAIAMSLCLTKFLQEASGSTEAASFANPWFLLANACIPVIFGLRHLDNQAQKQAAGSTCLETAWFLEHLSLPASLRRQHDDDNETAATVDLSELRGFPIIVLFHGIVTACVWFMLHQARQQEGNLRQIVQVRKQLAQEKQEANKKKAK